MNDHYSPAKPKHRRDIRECPHPRCRGRHCNGRHSTDDRSSFRPLDTAARPVTR